PRLGKLIATNVATLIGPMPDVRIAGGPAVTRSISGAVAGFHVSGVATSSVAASVVKNTVPKGLPCFPFPHCPMYHHLSAVAVDATVAVLITIACPRPAFAEPRVS